MTAKEYICLKSFRAPKVGSNPLEFKDFREGESIYGSLTKNINTAVVNTLDGFNIPAEYMRATGKELSEMPNDIQEKVDSIKNKDIVKDAIKTSKKSVNGALIGGVIGLITAWQMKKPVYPFVIGGIVLGGVIGYYLTKKD